MINQLEDERTLWILKNNWEGNVGIVEELVVVLEIQNTFGNYETQNILFIQDLWKYIL